MAARWANPASRSAMAKRAGAELMIDGQAELLGEAIPGMELFDGNESTRSKTTFTACSRVPENQTKGRRAGAGRKTGGASQLQVAEPMRYGNFFGYFFSETEDAMERQ